MKIGVLTSSRADYGIYLPLLEALKKDAFFTLEIIAFGTHLSKLHGFTLNQIEAKDKTPIHKINMLLTNDDEASIATSYGITTLKFADFWQQHKFDLVLCLGDRFEMSAAVQAGIPYRVKFAHIHGGETTLGAIDNIYRHQITLASALHFTSSKKHSQKIVEILGESNNIHTVGALSLDEIESFQPIEKELFYKKFHLKNKPFALITFHPETVSVTDNEKFALETLKGLSELAKDIELVITMPNADTLGSVFREAMLKLKKANPNQVILIENFGKINYFSAMHYASILIGNTSSGIIEAASFNKYVVNVGDRQKGRDQSENIINIDFNAQSISNKTKETLALGDYKGKNVYYKDGASSSIIKILKKENDKL
ncbi:MAG: UDP-N-acetylglucosamine 2-epimerase [Oceanihabitans sp.]